MVGSDDDMAPALQLWDLRNSVSPLRELRGHRAGVLGLSWCPQDPAFLISSAKDNRSGPQALALALTLAGWPAAFLVCVWVCARLHAMTFPGSAVRARPGQNNLQ